MAPAARCCPASAEQRSDDEADAEAGAQLTITPRALRFRRQVGDERGHDGDTGVMPAMARPTNSIHSVGAMAMNR